MKNITKLYPVFLTYGGWMIVPQESANENPAVPESALGGCPKCWSPVLPEEAGLCGVCVCCGWSGTLEEVLSGEDLMVHEIRWNTSKHYPGGALPHSEHWKIARHIHVGGMISQGLLALRNEKPDWWKVLEAMWLAETDTSQGNFNLLVASHPSGMKKVFAGLDGYAERARGLAESLGCSGSYSARKAFLEKSSDGKDNYPPHSFRSVIAATSKASEEEIKAMAEEYGIDLPHHGAIETVHKNKDEDKK